MCEEKREKVLRGLACLSNPFVQDADERDCEHCSYDSASCFLDITSDALSLLKAQEPIDSAVFELNPDDYVRIGDILECFDGMDVSDDAVFHAVGLIQWAFGKRNITKEELKNELIKEQVPHVMTPEEVEKVGQGDIIWEELRCNNECIPLMRERNDFYFPHKAYLHLGEIIDCDDYGRNYRCWTSRPTDAQREAVKWE